jgi:hypothetical protein
VSGIGGIAARRQPEMPRPLGRRSQRRLIANDGASGARRVPALLLATLAAFLLLSSATQATLLPISGHSAKYKPLSFCPANQTCFSETQWTLWTHRRAVARATESFACAGVEPSQCQSPSQKVRIVLSQPRRVCGGLRYTRAHWRPEPGVNLTETTFFDAGLGGVGGRGASCIWSGG